MSWVVCSLAANQVHAQPVPTQAPAPAAPIEPERAVVRFDSWGIAGILLEDEPTVRAVLAPEIETRRELTEAAQQEIVAACARLGYHLVRLLPQTSDGHTHLVVTLEPLPQVRLIHLRIEQSLLDPLLDDELARRLGIRRGEYLPYGSDERAAYFREEQGRLAEYLRDQGYFEAGVRITASRDTDHIFNVNVRVDLGPAYRLGKVRVANAGTLAIGEQDVLSQFRHNKFCLFYRACFGQARFSRSQLQTDLDAIVAFYQARGYPGVKVSTDFDPLTSFDRKTKTVDLTVTIDERRPIDVVFRTPTGVALPEEALRKQLTFNEAASADDYEMEQSAAKIRRYLQGLGYFDVFVNPTKVRLSVVDRIVFDIDLGPKRRIDAVEIEVQPYQQNPKRFTEAALRPLVSVEPFRDYRFLSSNRSAVSEQLAADRERIALKYAQVGYPAAVVEITIANTSDALGNPALVAAELAGASPAKGLRIHYTVHEGPPDTIDQIAIAFVGPHGLACPDVVALMQPHLGNVKSAAAQPCQLDALDLPNVEAPLRDAATAVQTSLATKGHLHAEVRYEVAAAGDGKRLVTFTVYERNQLRLGKVIVRGNFRTKTWVLRDELGFGEGEVLTSKLYTDGPSRLRSTNLFGSVIVDPLNFDDGDQQTANMLVRVVDRYDRRLYLDFEAGYSTQNGLFGRVAPRAPNLFGVGFDLDGAILVGVEMSSAEANARVPRWLLRRAIGLRLDLDISFFARSQQTERFGRLTTQGGSLKTSRTWQRATTTDHGARSISLGFRYDYRRRNRDETTTRLPLQSTTDSRVPVVDVTGQVGLVFNLDARTDRSGELNPLAPTKGYRVELGASYASPYLLGQDTFAKLYGIGQWTKTLGSRLAVRLDLRHDHGIPLDNEALIPEVERFFAGGDTTVRGYAEDRLEVEAIRLALPPFDTLEQWVILPAGGNIRTVLNADLEIRLARLGGFAGVASGVFVDTGAIVNTLGALAPDEFRSSIGISLIRFVTPFGTIAADWAVPLSPRAFDRANGRFHFSIALRN